MIIYRTISTCGLLICLFLCGCVSQCWVCDKEKGSLDIKDYTEQLAEVAFESFSGMENLLRCVFVQYKNTHQSTQENGTFYHVRIVEEEFVHLSSQNAVLNPYLELCDADHDQFITDREVEQFKETYDATESP